MIPFVFFKLLSKNYLKGIIQYHIKTLIYGIIFITCFYLFENEPNAQIFSYVIYFIFCLFQTPIDVSKTLLDSDTYSFFFDKPVSHRSLLLSVIFFTLFRTTLRTFIFLLPLLVYFIISQTHTYIFIYNALLLAFAFTVFVLILYLFTLQIVPIRYIYRGFLWENILFFILTGLVLLLFLKNAWSIHHISVSYQEIGFAFILMMIILGILISSGKNYVLFLVKYELIKNNFATHRRTVEKEMWGFSTNPFIYGIKLGWTISNRERKLSTRILPIMCFLLLQLCYSLFKNQERLTGIPRLNTTSIFFINIFTLIGALAISQYKYSENYKASYIFNISHSKINQAIAQGIMISYLAKYCIPFLAITTCLFLYVGNWSVFLSALMASLSVSLNLILSALYFIELPFAQKFPDWNNTSGFSIKAALRTILIIITAAVFIIIELSIKENTNFIIVLSLALVGMIATSLYYFYQKGKF